MQDQMQSLEVLQKQDPVVKGLGQSLEKFKAEANSLAIISPDQEVAAVDFIKPIKDYSKLLDAKRKELTHHARGYVNTINDFFNSRIRELDDIERTVKNKLIDYRRQVEDAARKEQARIDEANRKKAEKYNERVNREMERAEEKGVDPRYVKPPNIQEDITLQKTAKGERGGVTYKKVKCWRLMDIAQVPREYLMLDEKKITKVIQADVNIPGIEIFEKTISSIR